ncbi:MULTISPECIES: hypothetical protein [unclassified Pseudoalteromonas]|jgi:hypothetical protein|uniref:hypothetical protein n=1 Tax=unclassified Pseudoalteromonas TaxID=194690 RepID=UPI0005670EB1|nr:hypothetical protein [Pseudoalteromonas sp. A2]|tara:strand:+ start:868 stop:1335 length:468 start_codon:yes stop_codon:yes gene_type:complete
METVYQISFLPSFEQVKVLLIFSVLGPAALLYAYKNKDYAKRRFTIFWGGTVSITAPLILLYLIINHVSTYMSFQSKEFEVIKGKVSVLRTQPKEGHAPGDLIKIADREIEIDYYVNSPCYHQTISNGGVLQAGKLVALYVSNNCILKVEVSKES